MNKIRYKSVDSFLSECYIICVQTKGGFPTGKLPFLFCITKKVAIAGTPKYHFPKNDLRANSNSYILFSFGRSIPQALYIALQSNKNLSMTYQKEKARHFHVVFFLVFAYRFCALCSIFYIIFFISWLIILFLRCYNVFVTKKTYLTHLFEQQS